MRDHVPCGACVALVPADEGCEHWRPKLRRVTSPEESARIKSEQHRKARARERAREQARVAVQEFQQSSAARASAPPAKDLDNTC
jgi:hypothetical protein